eukprot:3841572-Pleurochrysis_carterae.AAC.1
MFVDGKCCCKPLWRHGVVKTAYVCQSIRYMLAEVDVYRAAPVNGRGRGFREGRDGRAIAGLP